MREIAVPEPVLAALSSATLTDNRLILAGQMDRAMYAKVMKVIEAAGGKWDRKAKAHLFDGNAADVIEPILLTGTYSRTKQDFGQFDTPPELAQVVVELADIKPGMKVLEPSCGIGNLVAAVIAEAGGGASVFGYEIDPKRHAECVTRHFSAFGAGSLGLGDFLAVKPEPVFDRVVMNPPFARQADIEHVEHALHFLRPGGRLVSIMSASVGFRLNQRSALFRLTVSRLGGTISPLPPGSFRSSGTDVNAVIVTIQNHQEG